MQRFDRLGGAKFTANRAVYLMYQAGAAMFFAGATTGVVRCGAVFDPVLTSDSKVSANACARWHPPVRPSDPPIPALDQESAGLGHGPAISNAPRRQ